MLHNIIWKRKPYYKHNNLKSINIDHLRNTLDITIFPNMRKEYVYNLKAENINKIELCIGYTKSGFKVIFFMITYKSKSKNNMISFYLPRKYDKKLVEDIKKFATDREITFEVSKSINPLAFVITFMGLFYLIRFLMK